MTAANGLSGILEDFLRKSLTAWNMAKQGSEARRQILMEIRQATAGSRTFEGSSREGREGREERGRRRKVAGLEEWYNSQNCVRDNEVYDLDGTSQDSSSVRVADRSLSGTYGISHFQTTT